MTSLNGVESVAGLNLGWISMTALSAPVHHTVAETLIFFPVFLLFTIAFFFIGFYTIRNTAKTARVFNTLGSKMYGRRLADRVYAPGNLLYAAWPFVIFSPIGGAFAIYQIIHTLVTGLPA